MRRREDEDWNRGGAVSGLPQRNWFIRLAGE
jgi:hypothetical protein